jgi:formylglycine-generating enzyme required for sulfatase activity
MRSSPLLVLAVAACSAEYYLTEGEDEAPSEEVDSEVAETDGAVETDEPAETDEPVETDVGPSGCTPGSSDVHPALGTLVCVPSGTFTMGCVPGRDDVVDGACSGGSTPSRTVELTRPFWVMEAEVTQARYAAVMGSNPSAFSGSDLPVETVSWDDAVAFADAVSAAEGLTPCGRGDPYACDGWRLPTEAEWEYAARGGQGFAFAGSGSVDAVAWYAGNSDDTTHPVCTRARNGFGLCDLSGNVFEWTVDRYGEYPGAASTDPTGPTSGSERVTRGGSWISVALPVSVAARGAYGPDSVGAFLGFRLVRSVP